MQWTKQLDKKAQWVPLGYKVDREFKESWDRKVIQDFQEPPELKMKPEHKEFKDYLVKMIKTGT